MDQIKKILSKAIKDHISIRIIYNNESSARTIHPYHYGLSGDKQHLHCFQTSGPSKSGKPIAWKNFALDNIVTAELTPDKFTPPDIDLNGKTYNRTTKYSTVECQIQFD